MCFLAGYKSAKRNYRGWKLPVSRAAPGKQQSYALERSAHCPSATAPWAPAHRRAAALLLARFSSAAKANDAAGRALRAVRVSSSGGEVVSRWGCKSCSSSGLLLSGWFHFLLLSACVCRNISRAADIHRSCNAAWLCGTLNPDASMLMHLGHRPPPAARRWCPGSRIEAESKPMEPSYMPAEPKPS